MLDAIESFVTDHCSPERVGVYREAILSLEDFSVMEFETDAMNLVAVAHHYGTQQSVDLFHNKMEDYITQILIAHDVTLNDDASLGERVLITNIIKSIENYIDHDAILQVTESDGFPIDKFLLLAELVSDTSQERISTIVNDVSPDFIDQVEELHLRVLAEDEQTERANPKLIEQLRLVRSFLAKEDALGMKMVRNRIPLGASIHFYLEYAKKHVEYLEDDDLAKELFLLLCMASDTYTDVIQGFRKFSHQVFNDLVRTTKVHHRITGLAAQFQSFKLAQANAQ